MRVREIHVAGYRSIRDARMVLGQLTVIVGPNGSGKTNLYRSLLLLSAAAQGNLAKSIAEEGGMPSVLWAGERRKGPVTFSLGVEFEDLAYEIVCGLVPTSPTDPTMFRLDPHVKEERVSVLQGARRLVQLERKASSAFARSATGEKATFPATLWENESVLSQLAEPHLYPTVSAVRAEFSNWRFYHHFRTDPEALAREAQVGIRTPVLSRDGRDLAAAVQTIREIGDGSALERTIEAALPGSRLEVTTEGGRFELAMSMPGLHRPLAARELSDGTLRYVCLAAALLSPRSPPLIALNEPETSLHPDLIGPLAALIQDASRTGQVWVTTHSRELAKALSESKDAVLVSLSNERGESRIAVDE